MSDYPPQLGAAAGRCEIDRLRVELAAAHRRARAAENYTTQTEAALARVRELCHLTFEDGPNLRNRVLRALDGAE